MMEVAIKLRSGWVGYPKKQMARDALDLFMITQDSQKSWRKNITMAQLGKLSYLGIESKGVILYNVMKMNATGDDGGEEIVMEWNGTTQRMF